MKVSKKPITFSSSPNISVPYTYPKPETPTTSPVHPFESKPNNVYVEIWKLIVKWVKRISPF